MQRKSTASGDLVVPLLSDDKVARHLTDKQQQRIVERNTDEAVRFITASRKAGNKPFVPYYSLTRYRDGLGEGEPCLTPHP